jgi:hypothetical protein
MSRPPYLYEDDDFDRVVEEERNKRSALEHVNAPRHASNGFLVRSFTLIALGLQAKRQHRVALVRRNHSNPGPLALARMACRSAIANPRRGAWRGHDDNCLESRCGGFGWAALARWNTYANR